MDVVLTVGGEIVVDDEGHLLHINTTSQKVGGDQDTRRAGTELLHDQVTLALVHVTVHGGDCEVTGSKLVGKPVNLSPCVAEDDSLGDGDCFVEIGESIEFPVFLLDCNVELLDTLESELSLLDQNADRITHELRGDFQDVLRHGSREKDHLSRLREELEDVVDLLGETTLIRG